LEEASPAEKGEDALFRPPADAYFSPAALDSRYEAHYFFSRDQAVRKGRVIALDKPPLRTLFNYSMNRQFSRFGLAESDDVSQGWLPALKRRNRHDIAIPYERMHAESSRLEPECRVFIENGPEQLFEPGAGKGINPARIFMDIRF
jgi:hypothetical protein